jgi:cation-transporting P-type ATPase E
MASTLTEAGPRIAQPVDGLSEAEAARRLQAAGRPAPPASSRSYLSIVRANVLTVFNAILAAFGIVTLVFGDWRDALFLGIIVANSSIGIFQETRAKRALDRLALLVAPRARVVRDGVERQAPVEEVLAGDLVRLRAGDQVIGDGRLTQARELRLDESVLTGESQAVSRSPGEEVRSGAFAVEGSGAYLVQAVGADSFAAKLVGEARSFRHPRSPLERSVNRLLYALVALVVLLGGLLGFSLYHRHVGVHEAVATSAAGVVSLVPEGMIVLVSLTYAAAAVRMGRRGVLAQQLNAIESLASVEVLCVDKTGTLTEAALRVAELLPAEGVSEQELRVALGRLAASASSGNATLEAIAAECPAEAESLDAEAPFSSRRRWSGVEIGGQALLLGAPERFVLGPLQVQAALRQRQGRRVLALARSHGGLRDVGGNDERPAADDRTPDGLPPADAQTPGELPPADAQPLGLVILAERLRPHVQQTVAYLLREGVEIKVLSGDAPQTVAAIARDVGIPLAGVNEGAEIPDEQDALARFAASASVIGRISPEGKRAVVQVLHGSGRYVAMLGDGVNDVPALKSSRLAIAQGTGAQMTRSVSDLVLLNGDFETLPALVDEGRRALRNLQRVAKLYLTKSAFAAFLILTVGISSDAYPLLPRHLTLTAAIAIGIPTFFLALAPSTGPWRPQGLGRRVARFAVPAGTIAGTGTIAGYLFALHDLDYSVVRSRTVAATALVAVGLYLVLVLEATGSKRRSALVGTMCAALAGVYAAVWLLPATRSFFQLAPPTPGVLATALAAAALAIGALAIAGYSPIPAGEPAHEGAAKST